MELSIYGLGHTIKNNDYGNNDNMDKGAAKHDDYDNDDNGDNDRDNNTENTTVKPVYNDYLIGYFSVFWSSSRRPRAT